MVERLVDEAIRAKYDFDPAMLVAPSGTLDAPIMLGLHWPPLTENLPEYPTMRDMEFNPCIKWLAKKFGGLDGALTFDFRPLAFRKPKDYTNHPPWHEMPYGMLDIIDESLQEMMEAATAKVAVYFGRHDYDIYRSLYPDSETLQLSDIPMYGHNFTHACVEYIESGPNSGEIRRVVFFCFHPGSYLYPRSCCSPFTEYANNAPEAAIRGIHDVQAKLMDDLCDLAAVIVGRSGICHDMFHTRGKPWSGRGPKKSVHTPRPFVRKPTKGVPRELDLVLNHTHKYAFTMACRAYAKETKSGLLYTLKTLPKRLVSLIQLREIITLLTRRSAQIPRPGFESG
jgi:hypothetical protein